MAVRLVQKCGYIKKGGAARYMKYIATREKVERLEGNRPATKNQQQLIRDLLRDFPDSEKLFEYGDYQANPTMGNASAFISMVLDANAHTLKESDGYMQYIATRPRVERKGDHGLFSVSESVSLDKAMDEVTGHTGNVWTLIYSLRREDALRLGYDSATSWRQLLLSHQTEIAKAMKIPPAQLRWYAAFHDEGHHPHIHVMVWSADSKKGYLTKDGIRSMRSALTNEIFQDELHSLYQRKDISYKQVTAAARDKIRDLTKEMEQGICDNPIILEKMQQLSHALGSVTGRKVYGYLPKAVKSQVDDIVNELAQIPEVAECYDVWNDLRDELEGYYKEKPRQHLPLSQQKEFRAILNTVIQEAENLRLGAVTFEDEDMPDEPEAEEEAEAAPADTASSRARSVYKAAAEYQMAKAVLMDSHQPDELKHEAVRVLVRLWDEGYTVAAHQLGKVWRDGLCGHVDEERAEEWFCRSAEAGNDYSQYALGKLLQGQGRIKEAVEWYKQATKQGNHYASYRLGKLYLLGKDVPKDVEAAISYLTTASMQNNQFAQYTLGKLYLQGHDVKRDREAALKWLTLSATQGNQYAQFFLDHFNEYRDPSFLLCATRLLHHMGQIFRQTPLPTNPMGIRVDSKRRRALLEKRLAMGHKIDDHEEAPITPTHR